MEIRRMTNSVESEQMSKYGHLVDEVDLDAVAEEIKRTLTEGLFASNWALIETYWLVGKIITENSDGLSVEKLVHDLALKLNKNRRSFFYAYKFYQQFPDLNLLPEGKDSRWYHIVQKYLTDGKNSPVEAFSSLLARCRSEGVIEFERGGETFVLTRKNK